MTSKKLLQSFHSFDIFRSKYSTRFIDTLYEKSICRITLSNPKKRNVLSAETLKELNSEFDKLSSSKEDIRAVVIAGNGPVFSSGHDLKELAVSTNSHRRQVFEDVFNLVNKIRSLPVPVIARVHALAAAAGCQLVAACDMAVALEKASFSTPGITLGLFCTTPGVLVARSVPAKVALDMLVTGQPISASEALRAGLVSRVVKGDEGDLDKEIDMLTQRICSFSRDSIALGKQTFYSQICLPFDKAASTAVDKMVENLNSDDAKAGLAKFGSSTKK